MEKALSKEKVRKQNKRKPAKSKTTSYRLKCARTANGLSHFVMYGDAPQDKTLL